MPYNLILIFSIVILIYLIASCIRLILLNKKKEEHVNDLCKTIKQKTNIIDKYFNQIANLSSEKNNFHERVIELENSIEKSYGVSIRNEVTNVKADFNKLEMVIMLAGVSKLISSSKSIDDVKACVVLNDKIQSFINDMKEGEF